MQFLCQRLDPSRNFRDLPLPRILRLLRAGFHELEIVDRDELDPLVTFFAAGFGAEFVDGNARSIVDEKLGIDDLHRGIPPWDHRPTPH